MLAALIPENDLNLIANDYYDQLVAYGRDALTGNPISDISAPARGRVVWAEDAHTLGGYAISKINSQQSDPESKANFEAIGFAPDMQDQGIWVVRQIAYQYQAGKLQWPHQPRQGRAYAHYDTTQGWHVVRNKENGASYAASWPERWEPSEGLTTDELAAINRVAAETAMVVDSALCFGDNVIAYNALLRLLQQRAVDSGKPDEVVSMGIITEPWRYMHPAYTATFGVTGYSQLPNLAPGIYRAIIGQAQRDSTGIEATATVLAAEVGLVTHDSPTQRAPFCPPYEVSTQTAARPQVATLAIPPSRYALE